MKDRPTLFALAALATALTAPACAWAQQMNPQQITIPPAAAIDPATLKQVEQLAGTMTGAPAGARIEIEPGQLDPRLRLAPCQRVEPYLPAGQRPWGRTRVGLRCTSGPVAWNVYLPVTVHVYAPAVVAAAPLAAGSELAPQDLKVMEVDIAERPSPTFADPAALVGRRLAQPLAPLTPVRADSLRARQWFSAGDPVTVVARGDGFAVSGEGLAMTPGLEGQAVRVRTENGRIVVGLAVGERRVEVPM